MSYIPELYFFFSTYFIFFFFTLRNYSSVLNFVTEDSIIYILYLMTSIVTIVLLSIDTSYNLTISENFVAKTYVSNSISIFLQVFFLVLIYLVKSYFSFLNLSCGVYLFVMSNAIFCLHCLLHSNDFFFAFILLECISICLYILCGYNKKDIESIESALKYFIIGTFSSIILLIGISFLFGLFNSLYMEDLQLFISYELVIPNLDIEVITCLSFIALGLLIKTYSAPFHYWAIDIYEGAPLTSSFFFSIIYLTSVLYFFLKLYVYFFINFEFFQYYFLFFAINCLFFGTFGSIFQRKIRKLIAYSSVNTVGFILLAFSTFDLNSIQQSFFFFFTYLLNLTCLFIILIEIKLVSSNNIRTIQKISDFAILSSSNSCFPIFFSICFFFSSGIPPFLYFISKSFLFYTFLSNYYIMVVIFLTIMSLCSYFYFIRIVKLIYYNNVIYLTQVTASSKLSFNSALLFSFFFSLNVVSFYFFQGFSNFFYILIISL